MSVTFSVKVEKERKTPAPCPKCGAGNGTYGDPSCDQKMPDGYECFGYGDTSNGVPTELEMNVANASAKLILREILNFGAKEKDIYGGTLDPTDVLIRLTTAEYRISSLVRPTTETQGVILTENGVAPGCKVVECGMNEERLQGYVDKLRILANKAIELETEITYG